MAKRDFNEWLSGFRPSIADYGFYINFDKVYRNVDDIKVELNILNSLIGSHILKKSLDVYYQDIQKYYNVFLYY